MPGPDPSCSFAANHGATPCPLCGMSATAQPTRFETVLAEQVDVLHAQVATELGRLPRDADDVKERTVRHMTTAHAAEAGLLDETWLDDPVTAHQHIHLSRPEDLPRPGEVSNVLDTPRLSDDLDNYRRRISARLTEMLSPTLQPIVIEALTTQVALTTASWIRGYGYGLMHDSREQLEMLRLADIALLEP